MFQNELENLDDSETLESINYEAEQRKFDDKLSRKLESFYLDFIFVREDPESQHELGGGAETGNMMQTLKMKIRQLGEHSELAKRSQVDVSAGTEKHAKMKQEAEKLRTEKSALAKAVEEITKTADQKNERLRAGRCERASQSNVVEDQRKKVTAELSAYQETLGLEIITSTRGGTLLIFSNIHRDNPERKFSVELTIGEGSDISLKVFG